MINIVKLYTVLRNVIINIVNTLPFIKEEFSEFVNNLRVITWQSLFEEILSEMHSWFDDNTIELYNDSLKNDVNNIWHTLNTIAECYGPIYNLTNRQHIINRINNINNNNYLEIYKSFLRNTLMIYDSLSSEFYNVESQYSEKLSNSFESIVINPIVKFKEDSMKIKKK